MQKHYEAIIIGAGLVGLCVAYYLTKAGLSTITIDKGFIGGGASGAGNGNIIVGNRQPGILAELARRSLEEYERIRDWETGDFELERRGSFLLLEGQEEAQEARGFIARQNRTGLSLAYLQPGELAEAVPGISADVAGGVYCRNDCSINPLLFLRVLKRAIERSGGSMAFYERVLRIEPPASGCFRVSTDRGEYSCRVLIDCAGVQAGDIAGLLGEQVPVLPNKGHIVVTEKAPFLRVPAKLRDWRDLGDALPSAERTVNTVIEATASGNLLIGKSEENGESSSGVSLLIVREVLARAIRFMPQLRDVRVIRIYTGLRPQSGDGLPLIGASARIAGFYYACGHGGDGVTSAPITGRLLSQLIVDGKTEQILRELSPARFA